MVGSIWQVAFRFGRAGAARHEVVSFVADRQGKVCNGRQVVGWRGLVRLGEVWHGTARQAGMVGFGWSGKSLTGQSWEWQVWNQKKGAHNGI